MSLRSLAIKNSDLNGLAKNTVDVLVYNINFNPDEKYDCSLVSADKISFQNFKAIQKALKSAFRVLRNGGLLFVYGIPKRLPRIAVFLDQMEDKKSKMVFKYWIGSNIDSRVRKETLPPAHTGLLMYLKSRKAKTNSPFHLNTKTVRVKYEKCRACNKYVKDWGGKSHLRNPLGAALSDVWRDLPKQYLVDDQIPNSLLDRIHQLTQKENFTFIYVYESHINFKKNQFNNSNSSNQIHLKKKTSNEDFTFDIDVVIKGDSLKYMKKVFEQYPDGIFDLVFADPPYNLAKMYNHYKDALSDKKYLNWSFKWLDLMSKVVKPGGALFVLNLPKYSTHYADYLNKKMNFRHWIIWDAMSTPAGKLMPAHYALLYYTKPGGPITFNYSSKSSSDKGILNPLDAEYYCLHSRCIKKRRKLGYNDSIDLDDVWWNTHRIKHKKDRDYHPCQLPIKLMERIIKLTTNRGDIVFDPFSGAGTTAISAKMNGRHFITLDMDEKYIQLTKKNLQKMQLDLSGNYYLPRPSINHKRSKVTKKEVEIAYFELCLTNSRVLELKEIEKLNSDLFKKITEFYKNFKKLKKMANRKLEIQEQIE